MPDVDALTVNRTTATHLLQHCPTCGAHIYWLKHERTGKTAPIDAQLHLAGNIAIDLCAQTYRVVSKPQVAHLNHWVTCTRPPAKEGR